LQQYLAIATTVRHNRVVLFERFVLWLTLNASRLTWRDTKRLSHMAILEVRTLMDQHAGRIGRSTRPATFSDVGGFIASGGDERDARLYDSQRKLVEDAHAEYDHLKRL
jgi:hypothetical protein